MQVFNQVPGVRYRVHTHTSVANRQDFSQVCVQTAILVEQLFRSVAVQPIKQCRSVLHVLLIHWNRNLVGAERPFVRHFIPFFRAGPAFRCAENQHRPYWAGSVIVFTRVLLDCCNSLDDCVQNLRHFRVHQVRIFTFYKERFPAHACEICG
ncbi:hypothetical protein D3C73_831980 [compost metagenome]